MRRRSSAWATDTLPMHRLFRLNDLALRTLPDTFDERMKWSRWGTYLPAIRTVFRKLIFIYLSDAYALIVPLTSQETTHELFCAWWSHSSLNYRTPGWNSQSRLVATALAWSPQWCTYLLIIQGSSWTFRFFVKDRHGVTWIPTQRPSVPAVVLSEVLYFFSHFYDNYKPMSP